MRNPTYSIHRCSYLPEHNRPHVWFEVWRGDDPRDYMLRDYAPATCVGKYRTHEAAESAIVAATQGAAA